MQGDSSAGNQLTQAGSMGMGQGGMDQGGMGQGGMGQGTYRSKVYDPYVGVPAAAMIPSVPTMAPNQMSSQFMGQDPPPVHLSNVSWTHQPTPPMRVFRKNDIITIRVDEITQVLAEGGAETRKQTLFETVLSDWIRLENFRLRPDPQNNGDPTISTESNQSYRAEATVESRESVTFNIAAKIVDVRPNGTILLEARKTIRINDNLWETSLSGSCRVNDIAADNVVLSKNMIDLELRKDDRGHLRDGYRRGWFQRWIDRVSPF